MATLMCQSQTHYKILQWTYFCTNSRTWRMDLLRCVSFGAPSPPAYCCVFLLLYRLYPIFLSRYFFPLLPCPSHISELLSLNPSLPVVQQLTVFCPTLFAPTILLDSAHCNCYYCYLLYHIHLSVYGIVSLLIAFVPHTLPTPTHVVASKISGNCAAICTAFVVAWCNGRWYYEHSLGISVQNFSAGWMCWFRMSFYFKPHIWPGVSLCCIPQMNNRWASNFVQISKNCDGDPGSN
jgi:hypothetical protein